MFEHHSHPPPYKAPALPNDEPRRGVSISVNTDLITVLVHSKNRLAIRQVTHTASSVCLSRPWVFLLIDRNLSMNI